MATEGNPIVKSCGCVISFNDLGLYLITACDKHKQPTKDK